MDFEHRSLRKAFALTVPDIETSGVKLVLGVDLQKLASPVLIVSKSIHAAFFRQFAILFIPREQIPSFSHIRLTVFPLLETSTCAGLADSGFSFQTMWISSGLSGVCASRPLFLLLSCVENRGVLQVMEYLGRWVFYEVFFSHRLFYSKISLFIRTKSSTLA